MAKSTNVISEIAIGGEKGAKWGGFNNAVEDPRFLPLGTSPDQNNWITSRVQDNIQLRRGQALLGQTRRSGGRASGIGVGYIASTQSAYYSANDSLYYYNPSTLDTEEVGTNVLSGANGEDVWFIPYQNFGGFYLYLGSAHTNIFKIPLANPVTVVPQQSMQWFGNASIDQGRFFGMQKYNSFGSPDLTSLYISGADKSAPSTYTPIVDETVATGDGTTKTFVGTLEGATGVQITLWGVLIGGAINSGSNTSNITESGGLFTFAVSDTTQFSVGGYCMVLGATVSGANVNGNICVITTIAGGNITATPYTPAPASVDYSSGGTLYPLEVFQDNQLGILTSNLGGTGTINYGTGQVSVTFNTAPINSVAIIADYYDDNATSGGILDFTYNLLAPTIGQGYLQLQGGTGPILASGGFQGIEYQFHLYRIWNVALPLASGTYTDITNQQYWSHIGIPYIRAQYPTGDGILLLDNTNPSEPKYSVLEIPAGSTNLTVVPTWISQDLDLSLFNHNTSVVFRWGDYNILACQELVNGSPLGYNTVFFIQDTESGLWNKLDYSVTCLADFQGALLSGDSLSPNAFTLFSGLDDDTAIIDNYWNSSLTDLGLQGEKKVRYFFIQGLIQRPQSIKVSYGVNEGQMVEAFTILGTGPYVNSSSPVGVGSNTLGSNTIGSGEVTALPFEIQFPVMTDYFEYIQIQFQALGIGWAQINKFGFRDIRHKSLKSPVYNTIQP